MVKCHKKNCSILCWNVRGLNDGAKRASVRNVISASGASIVCLQETKIENWTQSLLIDTVGPELARNCTVLPAIGTAGGILLATSDRYFHMQPLPPTDHSTSIKITMLEENVSWCLTGVYGPQEDQDKINFLQEISNLKQQMGAAWLIIGDFNLIYRAEDKNNNQVNIQMMNRFKNVIDNLQLAPLDLRGRRFTWCSSSDNPNPTMTKIDHFLASTDWLQIFPRTDLQSLASMGSDHYPLFMQGDTDFDFYRGFRFESYWVDMPDFTQAVQAAWEQPVNTQDPMLRMHVKLMRTARALKIWRR